VKSGTRGNTPIRWRDYTPTIGIWSLGGGGNVSPLLGVGGGAAVNSEFTFGRYLFDPDTNLVIYDFIIQFGATGNVPGSGNFPYYLFSLPVPCRLQLSNYLGGNTGGPSSADRILGYGHVNQGVNQQPQVPIVFTPSDFPATVEHGYAFGRTTRRQDFAQAFCPYNILGGTFTTTAQTTKAVTWPGSITLYQAPTAADIQIAPTNAGGAAAPWFLTAVTTTGFTVNWAANNTGAYTWKLLGSATSLLVGSTAPWQVGSVPLDVIRGSLVYEADIQ
jgi:hypothetical protein